MQQTFPAGTAQKIVIFDVHGDLFVYGWEEQTLQVTTDGRIDQLQPEGDVLTIRNCADNLELKVPVETIIEARNIHGGVVIKNVRQVEAGVIGGDASIKEISGDVTVTKIGGDAALISIGGDLKLIDIDGGLAVKQAPSVHIQGHIGDDASFTEVVHADIERVDGDLVLIDTDEIIVKQVGGDLFGKSGIAILHAVTIGGDCQVQGNGNAEVLLENVGGDLAISGAARFEVGNAGNDCVVQGSAGADGKISNVGNDLKIIGAAHLQIGNVGDDCELRDVQGDVSLGHVGNDANIQGVAGALRLGNIGDDAHLRGIGGSVSMGNVGNDLQLQATFAEGSEVRGSVGGDAFVILPENANLTIRAHVGGDVTGHSIVSNFAGNFVNLVYGEGAARLELNVGGDLKLQGNEGPRSSSSTSTSGSASSWGNFGGDWGRFGRDWGREMSEFGREMEQFGRNLGRDISSAVSEATSSIGSDVASSVAAAKEQAYRAKREAEEQRRYAEQERQRARREAEEQRRYAKQEKKRMKHEGEKWADEQNPYFNVRINDREWKMGPERIDAIIAQARSAAADGVQGALEAVEQALKNIRINVPPTPPTAPTPPQPGVPPTPPTPGEPPAPPAAPSSYAPIDESANVAQNKPEEASEQTFSTEKSANPDQEREAILRMIAEGRISPEEGDLLLEALGS